MLRARLLPLASASLAVLLSGCSSLQPTPASSLLGAAFGKVMGGQQPVSLSTVTLSTYDPTNGFQIFATVISDANGNFTFPQTYACPSSNYPVVAFANGGNPGLTAGTMNNAIQLAAALGDCGTLSASTRLSINEVTTVVFAAQYSAITSASTLASVESAFARAAMLANSTTGFSPGAGLTSTDSGGTIPAAEINTLANIISACVNSTGSTASGTPCAQLFALTPRTGTGALPTTVFGALTNLESSPGSYNTSALFNLAPPTPPFQPSLATAPDSFALTIGYVGNGLLNITPASGPVGTTVTITSNSPSTTNTDCPFTSIQAITFGNYAAAGSYNSTTITATVPAGVPAGAVIGRVYTSAGYCTFSFNVQ